MVRFLSIKITALIVSHSGKIMQEEISLPFSEKYFEKTRFFLQNLLLFSKTCGIISAFDKRPVGQAVKTSPSHGENMGSIPVRVTKEAKNEPKSKGIRVRFLLF